MRLHALPPAGSNIPAFIQECIRTQSPVAERRLMRALTDERVTTNLPKNADGIDRLIHAVRGEGQLERKAVQWRG